MPASFAGDNPPPDSGGSQEPPVSETWNRAGGTGIDGGDKMNAKTAKEYAAGKLSCRYGAPMGRHDEGANPVGKLYCFVMPLDSGGYDAGGAYWGHGGGSVYAVTDGSQFRRYVRAHCRSHALAAVLTDCDGMGWHGALLPDSRYSARAWGRNSRAGFWPTFCGRPIVREVRPTRQDAALACWDDLAQRLGLGRYAA